MGKTKTGDATTYVVAKCIGCKHEQKIAPNEVRTGDMPTCEKCGNNMIAKKAVGGGT